MKSLYQSTVLTLLLALILCGAYPLAVTATGKILFSKKANGSILKKNGQAVGAEMIGQSFSKPEYFHGRPSAAGDKGYDASNSSGSNLGPTNPKLIDNIKANLKMVLEDNPGMKAEQVPVDLVTASGSGLDPHISPASALIQVERVAKARKASPEEIKNLVSQNMKGPQWGIFGEATVNVLKINLALDEKYPLAKE